MHFLNPLDKFYQWESEIPDKVFLREPVAGKYQELTWKETGIEVRKMAGYLKTLQLPAGSRIAIISKNCSHWLIADLAIMMAGYISVPLYPNLTSVSVRKILEHSESTVVFLGKLDNFEEMEAGIPSGTITISFPYYPRPGHLQWKDIISNSGPILDSRKPDPGEVATILYTSGTTGMPKGVMHTYHNYAFAAFYAVQELGFRQGERFFSYLPLCHIAEKMLVQVGAIHVGGIISFAESLETFPQNMRDAKMTVFLAVPRIWTKFQQSILQKLPSHKLQKLLKIPVISSLIKWKIRNTLGLGSAKHIFTGAAAASPAMLEFFDNLGIRIQEAYAMTENCCYSHVNLKKSIKIGTVGKALPYCEVKIGQDGEILVRHEALMKGYYLEPELTRNTFTEDGFLKTGDEGIIDKQGYLRITGRVKDLFKSSKGKYIAPLPIEMMLMENEDIEQVCVVGSGLPNPIALSILSEAAYNQPIEHIQKKFHELLAEVNKRLDSHEAIAKLIILKENWSIENGFLTPTLKVKRKIVEEKYEQLYEMWFGLREIVVWA